MVCAVRRAMPRTSRGDGDARGRRREIVERQRDHLREVGHGRFTAVVLPVGVGGEARRGVEGKRGETPGSCLRVERQLVW